MIESERAGLPIIITSLVIAFALTIYSSNIQRVGPAIRGFGNVCGPSGDERCYEPVLNAGFPLPYFFDNPSISARGNLSLLEDEFRILPFLVDVYLFGIVLSAMLFAGKRYLLQRRSS